MNILTSDEAYINWQVAMASNNKLTEKLDDLKAQNVNIENDIIVWKDTKRLLEILKNYKLEKRKDFILGVINNALTDIFEKDYFLDIRPREINKKSVSSTQKYDIIFFRNGIEIARNNDLLNSNGGGVLSIASLFFKILIGYLYSKNKFYIFDEALSQVSPQYRGRLSLFLRKFCEKYDFTLVVVSQTEELEEYAHLVYEVTSTVGDNLIPIMEVNNIIGEIPKTDYFYNDIKNFQSIINQKFVYKGFTIIRGPNDSGKSASLRAVESILFNNFKPDLYPRKNPGGQKLTTELTFGHVDEEGNTNQIGLKYKSNKIVFVIEGEEYFGKSLASTKLKEAVENIGFKYIDVKQLYKNFKGPLKDQTERIAYTNQYDGLFLIGSKTSDSEKVFNFLFNTENIALAISQAQDKLLENATLYKSNSIEIEKLLLKQDINNIEINLYINIYYNLLIKEINLAHKDINIYKQQLDLYKNLYDNINIIIKLNESDEWFNDIKKYINKCHQHVDKLGRVSDIVNNCIDLNNDKNLIGKYIDIYYKKIKYKNKFNCLCGVIIPHKQLINLNTYFDINSNMFLLKNNINSLNTKIGGLDSQYKITVCKTCLGKGLHPI